MTKCIYKKKIIKNIAYPVNYEPCYVVYIKIQHDINFNIFHPNIDFMKLLNVFSKNEIYDRKLL